MAYSAPHVPVLLEESVEMLNVHENDVVVDATVGLGGHAEALRAKLGERGALIGIDRDEAALRYARERLGNGRVQLRQGSFSEVSEIVAAFGVQEVDAMLFDLGVSMLQLKELERGFSFFSEERLDMRMDRGQRLTAWDVVNKYPEAELGRILREYGEEPFARRIARAIAAQRKTAPIATCADLASLVSRAYGRRGKTHPATRTFQALRIEVNKELEELLKGLQASLQLLKAGGRVCVISYHSLEDRVVKNFFRDHAKTGELRLLTKKPLVPGPAEIRQNPSARSAKLRGAERL